MSNFRKSARITAGALALLVVAWLAWGRARAPLHPAAPPDAADDGRSPGSARTSAESPSRPPAAAPDGRRLRGTVDAREVDVWTLRFVGGKPARIWVAGEGDASLDCVAQDAAGNLLDVQARGTARCHLRWCPARTGSYRIMVRNSGSARSVYQLVTN